MSNVIAVDFRARTRAATPASTLPSQSPAPASTLPSCGECDGSGWLPIASACGDAACCAPSEPCACNADFGW